jgi:predicted neuraminidase
MMKNIFFLVLLSMLFSCGKNNTPPPSLIQPKEMQSILWDVMRAETLASEIARKDSSVDVAIETKSLSQKVFSIHKTDSANFNKSYNWYVKHPDVLKIIFDSLYIQKERENHLRLKKKNIADSLVK